MLYNPFVWTKEELEAMLWDAKAAYKEMIKESKSVISFTSLGTSVTFRFNKYELESHINDITATLQRYYPEQYGKPVNVGVAYYS